MPLGLSLTWAVHLACPWLPVFALIMRHVVSVPQCALAAVSTEVSWCTPCSAVFLLRSARVTLVQGLGV
jgi:hypothetical protein